MKRLWFVRDNDRWGFSVNVVAADSAEEARKLVNPHYDPTKPNWRGVEVEELEFTDKSKILWCYDESPDSGESPED